MSRTLPLFPLGSLVFPGGPLPLRIFEPRYVNLVKRCMQTDSGFGVVLLFRGNEAGTAEATTAGIGTEVRIIDFDRLPDGLLGITCRGQQRFRILRAWREADGLNMAEVEDLPAPPIITIPADLRFMAEILERVMPELGEDYAALEARYDDAQWVSCRLAEVLAMETFERQALLELDDPLDRLQMLVKKVRGDD
jgi:Lon protease-like protein